MSDDALDAAVEYAGLGLRVFPVWGVRGGLCLCPKGNQVDEDGRTACSRGKHPMTKHGFKDATTDMDVLSRWWSETPDANVGIRTGPESGLVVLDADGPEGKASLFGLGTTALTWLAETSRGYHQFFRHPGNVHIKSRPTGLPGLDVKADAGYIVAPPSVHASGRVYTWKTPPSFLPLAELPGDVLKILLARKSENAALTDAADILADRRNIGLFKVAMALLRGGLDPAALDAALLEANRIRCRPPLGAEEVLKIAGSAAKRPAVMDARIAELRGRWAAYWWPGRTGGSDRAVVGAALDIAEKTGKTEVAMSVRDAADLGGISARAAADALPRVSAWLKLRRKGTASLAAVWRIQAPSSLAPSGNKPDPSPHTLLLRSEACATTGPGDAETRVCDYGSGPERQECATTGPGTSPPQECATTGPAAAQESLINGMVRHLREHDVWRRGGGGLGKVCLACYELLVAVGEISERALAERLGRKKVKKYLTALKRHGLATLSGGLWRPVQSSPEHLDRLARELGTSGRGARQKERHKREREERKASAPGGISIGLAAVGAVTREGDRMVVRDLNSGEVIRRMAWDGVKWEAA